MGDVRVTPQLSIHEWLPKGYHLPTSSDANEESSRRGRGPWKLTQKTLVFEILIIDGKSGIGSWMFGIGDL
jgi:hypothetical protein